MESVITIGEIIKYYRNIRKMSQADLSSGICSREYLNKIERGKAYPTIDIIDQLSEKLNYNIYMLYTQSKKHHDLDTHRQIEQLNDCFNIEKIDKLESAITECEQNPCFQEGEPFQCLMYAKGLYSAFKLRDYASATKYSTMGIEHKYETLDRALNPNNNLSHTDLALLQQLGINAFRLSDVVLGDKIYIFLIEYLKNALKTSRYNINNNYYFELQFLGSVTYNYFLFSYQNDSKDLNFLSSLVDSSLDLIIKQKFLYYVPELLLTRSKIKQLLDMPISAEQDYNHGISMATYLYTDAHIEKIKRELALQP